MQPGEEGEAPPTGATQPIAQGGRTALEREVLPGGGGGAGPEAS